MTNPPIDPIRESIVMSLATGVGAEGNLLAETPEHAHQLVMDQPILRNQELETLRHVDHDVFEAHTIDITWPIAEGPEGMTAALASVCDQATDAIAQGVNIIILSDRRVKKDRAPIPALLAVAAVHHHLVREGTRLRAGLVLESGEPREVHHFGTLIGYGASAVNPYLLLDTIDELAVDGRIPGVTDATQAELLAVKGIGKGLLKTISKMGISTIQSYCGAQIFEAVGLDRELIDRYFTGTASRIGGIGSDVLAEEALDRHARAYPKNLAGDLLPVGGVYAWRREGEKHMWNPETIAALQHAVRADFDGATPAPPPGEVRRVQPHGQRGGDARGHAARPAAHPHGRGDRDPGRRGRAGHGHRQALRHRRHVARLDLAQGPRDARPGDERHRRPLEHGRGRGGPRRASSTTAARRSSRSPRAASA